MKETKEKPLAKLTGQQLQDLRSNLNQIHSLGCSLDRAYSRKEEIMEKMRKAYSLPEVDFHVNLRTGEVFDSWPKV